MTLNEVMIRHSFITKVLLKEGNKELSKDLKVKLMSMRIEFGKLRSQFEEEMQKVLEELKVGDYNMLSQKQDRTEDETNQLQELASKITEEYNAYADVKGKESVAVKESATKGFTESEYNEIVEVNAGNEVEINGNKLQATDFLEVLYSLFVV